MEAFTQPIKRVFQYTIYALILMILLWLLLPYKVFLQGIMVGLITGMLNGFLLLRKTIQVGKQDGHSRRRIGGAGMVQRLVLGGFVIYAAFQLPELFSYIGAILGLMVFPLLSLFVFYFYK